MRKVCTEMLEQRGYKVTPNDEYLLATKDDDTIAAFTTPVKLSVPKIKEYVSWMGDLGVTHSIIIYTDITPPVKTAVKNPNIVNIELFEDIELKYNITNHRFVPAHRRLSTEEGEELVTLLSGQLPIMLVTDPISRFYNYKEDDIIEIIRKGSGYDEPAYRIVK